MEWSEVINGYVKQIKPVKRNDEVVQKIIRSLDYTSLNETDTESSISFFCERAKTSYGAVAGICVYPQFVRLVKDATSGSAIRAITVGNFPEGSHSLETVLIEIGQALEDGADEIDIVFPYLRYLAGERQYAQEFVSTCKAACGQMVLKMILETSALSELVIIADACHDALVAGADFVKTSTGKSGGGATLEAAATMLLVIKHLNTQTKRPMGLKVSGGIKEVEQAAQYIELADLIMGKKWVSPHTFRIGASHLMEKLIPNA